MQSLLNGRAKPELKKDGTFTAIFKSTIFVIISHDFHMSHVEYAISLVYFSILWNKLLIYQQIFGQYLWLY